EFGPQDRPAPVAAEGLTRMDIEIDGRMTTSGLPESLLAALGSVGGSASAGADAGSSPDSAGNADSNDGSAPVTAPVPGSLV
ncbi:hypothetical protein ABTC32_19135, partial [Acinetobacter baumannii]